MLGFKNNMKKIAGDYVPLREEIHPTFQLLKSLEEHILLTGN